MLEGFALFLFWAVLIERLVEYVLGTPIDRLAATPRLAWLADWKWVLMYAALAIGVLVAFQVPLNLIAYVTGTETLPLDYWLTGIAIGGGANLLHQIWPGPAPEGGEQ